MSQLRLVCCLILFQSAAHALDISVGGTQLSIPAPEGFAPVTSDMVPYAEIVQHFVSAENVQFALFISTEDARLAAEGDVPDAERRFSVQAAKTLESQFISASDFSQVMKEVKIQNEEIMKKAEARMPEILEGMNKGVSADYGVNLNLSMNEMLPFPPHYETQRAMAFSMLMKFSANDENGEPSVIEGAVTSTFVHIKGKLLFLYVYAPIPDLEWTKAEAQKWAEMIIATNPSEGSTASREAREPRSGFNWDRVGRHALVGAVIGGLIGLVGKFFRRKRA